MILSTSTPTASLKWIRWCFKQTCQKCPRYAINPTRKSPGTCSRMALTFSRLIFLGSFAFVQQKIHEVSQFSISAILQPFKDCRPRTHVCYLHVAKFLKGSSSNIKRHTINGIRWTCIRPKCWVTPNRNASKNVYKTCYDSLLDVPLDMFSSSKHICLFVSC